MSYTVTFEYMDGERVPVLLKDSKIKDFMESINKGEVYFDGEKGAGLWIPMDKIRHFKVKKEDDNET